MENILNVANVIKSFNNKEVLDINIASENIVDK